MIDEITNSEERESIVIIISPSESAVGASRQKR